MPSVFSKILGADKRVYLYGAIIAISAIGYIHFKHTLSQRDEIHIFTQQTSINKMDLVTTELPLLIAPFAGIDAIHYLTEIIYHLIQTHKINQKSLKYFGITGLLGFALPIMYVLRNKNINSTAIQKQGIRDGFKRFTVHIASILSFMGICGIMYRFFLWSLKFSFSAPFLVVGTANLYQIWPTRINMDQIKNDRKLQIEAMARLVLGTILGVVGIKIYIKMRNYEQYKMNKIYGGLRVIFEGIKDRFIWNDVEWKYVTFCGILIANLFNFLMDSVVSKYFMPFSFKIRNSFLDANNQWIYESYYYFMNDVNKTLPKEIFCEIFSYAGIEQDFRFLMENNECRIKYEEKHSYIQELSILAHICFSYVSYRELYDRIKAK